MKLNDKIKYINLSLTIGMGISFKIEFRFEGKLNTVKRIPVPTKIPNINDEILFILLRYEIILVISRYYC